VQVYENVNLSLYSGQACNARCPFCVEELRPLSKGLELAADRARPAPEEAYFERLAEVLELVRPLDPSTSITGGEPSIDPRLPRTLDVVAAAGMRKRTLTTNGSGLLRCVDPATGELLVDRIAARGVAHLNVSRASPDDAVNRRIMKIGSGTDDAASLGVALERARAGGARPRLSCVLLRGTTETVEDVVRYAAWARSLGVDNVVFRQLMEQDRERTLENHVTRYSDRARVDLWALLEQLHGEAGQDPRFRPVRQVLGYYYYVEVYELREAPGLPPIDVVFEGADLEVMRRDRERRAALGEDVVHELVLHPDGALCSTWQPRDGVLLPALTS
jgi:MoaA/NifB/PqqE/SkfB family radical SAM enzyme